MSLRLIISLLLTISPLQVFAQPLSQLDFDRGVTVSNSSDDVPTSEKIKELKTKKNLTQEELEVLRDLQILIGEEEEPAIEEKVEVKQEVIEVEQKKPEVESQTTTSLVKLNKRTVVLDGPDSFVPPSLAGPQVDSSNTRLITSQASWIPKSRSCITYSTRDEICTRYKALNEVVGRFTGDPKFLQGVCPKFCAEGQESIVSEVTLSSANSVQLKNVADGKECRVQMSSAGAKWLTINASSIECSCLPKGCGDVR